MFVSQEVNGSNQEVVAVYMLINLLTQEVNGSNQEVVAVYMLINLLTQEVNGSNQEVVAVYMLINLLTQEVNGSNREVVAVYMLINLLTKPESRKRTNFKAQTGKWVPKYTTSLLATSQKKPESFRSSDESKRQSPLDPVWTKSIEICNFEGSELKKAFNLPVALNEKSATVSDVAEFVSDEAFEGASVVLLDSENLQIPNTIGTQGMHICKNWC